MFCLHHGLYLSSKPVIWVVKINEVMCFLVHLDTNHHDSRADKIRIPYCEYSRWLANPVAQNTLLPDGYVEIEGGDHKTREKL